VQGFFSRPSIPPVSLDWPESDLETETATPKLDDGWLAMKL
jgi:hypothetical protein